MKFIIILITFFLSLTQVSAKSYTCTSSIIMEQSSRQVLEGKNIYHTQSVASISKIMTAIVVIENIDVTKEIIVPQEVIKAYGSAIYIQPNSAITILDLLYGLMLRSGNDAALCLSFLFDDFVGMMNEKAKMLNMHYTTFNNPSGLDEEDNGNISCAYDMALLMAYAMENDMFRQIVSTKKYERLDDNGTWTNKNKLLFNYDYCNGGKTGYTKKAGRTLVTSANNKGIELICVTIRCPEDFEFHQELYELYFKKYEYFFELDRF